MPQASSENLHPPARSAEPQARGHAVPPRPGRGLGGQRGVLVVVVLLFALLLLRAALIVWWPLTDTTEARYADIARRMVLADDWVTPWFDDGVPFWGKPPFSFWMTVASLRLFGFSEWAARLPHLLCMLAVVALAAQLAAERARAWPSGPAGAGAGAGPGVALAVSVLLLGSLVVFAASGAVMTDAPLVLGITLALVSFWRAMERPEGESTLWRWLFFVGLAVGVLAKGPLAVVLTGFGVLGWWWGRGLRSGGARLWRRLPWLGGTVLFAGLVVPWFAWAEQRTPGFLHYFLLGEHILRFTQPGWDGDRYGNAHQEAIGTIWAFAVAGFWPWSILLPAWAAARAWSRRRMAAARLDPLRTAAPAIPPAPDARAWTGLTLGWMLGPMLLFTPARNTIWMYVLPGAVGAALWAGDRFVRTASAPARTVLLSVGLLLAMATAVAYALDARAHLERRSMQALLGVLPQGQVVSPGSAVASPTAARLVFVGLRPFSASWYSNGRAERFPSPQALQARAGDLLASARAGQAVWVAIPRSLDGERPPELAGLIAARGPDVRAAPYVWWQLTPKAP